MTSRALCVLGSVGLGMATMLGHAFAVDLPETRISFIGSLSVQPQYRDLEQPFYAERLGEESGGAIQVQIRPWNELGLKGPEMMPLVRRGTYTGAALVLAYNSGEVPINDAMDLAGQSPDIPTLRKVVEAFRPVLETYYEEELGLKLLSVSPYPPQLTFCRDEFTSLEDFRGWKVRTSTASQAAFVRAIGGSDINMASTEVQAALQTGVVDCGITSALSAYKQAWYEPAKYLLPLPINWQLIVHAYNLDAWNSFDPGVQSLIQEETAWLEDQLWQTSEAEHTVGVNCMTGEGPCSEGEYGNMIKVAITDADRDLLRATFESTILPQWAERCGPDCAAKYNETIGAVLGVSAPVQ